mgnify:FL=1
MQLLCPLCGSEYPFEISVRLCPKCGSPLFVVYDISLNEYKRILMEARSRWYLGIWSFHGVLPARSIGKTLGEGWTPTIRLEHFSKANGVEVFVKNESRNPSGTFIDRGTAVDSYLAYSTGSKSVVSASTGDYAISLSMYAKVYGLSVTHYIPNFIEQWKKYMLMLLGDEIISVDDYDKAIKKALRMSNKNGLYLSIPLSPVVIDGYRTLVFELIDVLSNVDWIATPVGDGLLATSILKGLKEVEHVLGIETPNILAVKLSEEGDAMQESSKLFLTELRGGVVKSLLSKIMSGKGVFIDVDKEAIYLTANEIANTDGVVVDPVGATSLAGIKIAKDLGVIGKGDKVLAIVSGSPSKDTYILYKILEYSSNRKPGKVLSVKEDSISSIQEAILKILYEEKQCHAYGIWKKLRVQGYNITLQTVHDHIKKLLNKGFIRELGYDGRRRIYAVSELGKEYLESMHD